MFIVSMKTSRKKLVSYICIFLIFLAALIVWVTGLMKPTTSITPRESRDTAQGAVKQAADKRDVEKEAEAEGNIQRIEYLNKFGWTVDEEAAEVKDVAIPSEFSEVYKKYNEIQKSQGFDLTTYKGKACKRYTYIVKNYPNHTDDVRANILMDGTKIIGGDICSIQLNGFMHGFSL